MELSAKTRVNDLLTRYHFLKDHLTGLNPEFKMLDNAFMRRTVGRIATLGRVAMIGAMDVRTLLDGIAAEIKARTGEMVVVIAGGGASEDEDRIETMKGIIKDLHAGRDV